MSESCARFQAVARSVQARIALARWCDLLGRTAPVFFTAAAAVALLSWLRGHHGFGFGVAAGLVALWLLATAACAWFRRPSEVTALALWDERAGRQEVLTSAYCFASQPQRTAGETLHIQAATGTLQRERPKLAAQLPVRLLHRAWLLPLTFLALVGLVLVAPSVPVEPAVDDQQRVRAEAFAKEFAQRKHQFKQVAHLEADQREKLKELGVATDDTLEKLQQLDDETRRDVLAELARRAHEAEQLADELSGAGESLSSEMLAELERHADTSDFAAAARAQQPEKIADESEKLAKQLMSKKLSSDQRKRIERALEKALAAATASDAKGLIGKHLQSALMRLQKRQPQLASKQFSQLARQMRRSLQRQQTQQQLQQLARQLRRAGQQIFGRQQNMRRLASKHQQGLRQLTGQTGKTLRQISLRQRPGVAGNRPAALLPGPRGGQRPGQAPVPGAPGQQPGSPAPVPGAARPGVAVQGNQPGQGQIPIPGSGQGQQPGAGQLPGQGNQPGAGQQAGQGAGSGTGMAAPVPGAAAGLQGAGQGGHQAGHGSAPYGNTATKALAASKSLKTAAQISGDGPSLVRHIAGRQHREQTERQARELAVEFLKTEEESLAAEPLPVSRRNHVLRYFTALRRQLVESPPASP